MIRDSDSDGYLRLTLRGREFSPVKMQFTNFIAIFLIVLCATAFAKEINKDACVKGIATIASECERCARWGIECLKYPSYKKACEGGPDSPHSKACNACVDDIFKLWQ